MASRGISQVMTSSTQKPLLRRSITRSLALENDSSFHSRRPFMPPISRYLATKDSKLTRHSAFGLPTHSTLHGRIELLLRRMKSSGRFLFGQSLELCHLVSLSQIDE